MIYDDTPDNFPSRNGVRFRSDSNLQNDLLFRHNYFMIVIDKNLSVNTFCNLIQN